MTLRNWLLATRPKTLTAGIAPIIVATSLTYALNKKLGLPEINYQLSLWAVFATLFLQIGTNLVNDAQDFLKGSDTDLRLGPTRVTQSGKFTYRSVMNMAYASFFFAFLSGLPLIAAGSWPILLLGLVSIFAAYSYTAGPYPLAYNGLGEIFVIIFFGWVAVIGLGFLLTDGKFSGAHFVAGTQLGCLCCVLLAINNARDISEDRAHNKWTLAARFGLTFARFEIAVFFMLAYGLGFYWYLEGFVLAAFLPLFSAPLATYVLFKVFQETPSKKWNSYLAKSSAVLLVFSLLMSYGFLWTTP